MFSPGSACISIAPFCSLSMLHSTTLLAVGKGWCRYHFICLSSKHEIETQKKKKKSEMKIKSGYPFSIAVHLLMVHQIRCIHAPSLQSLNFDSLCAIVECI